MKRHGSQIKFGMTTDDKYFMPKPYIPNDKLSRKAKDMGFRARSVFKLDELNERYHLLKPGIDVLDLGAAPGSWLQLISQKIAPGKVLGLDLKEIDYIAENVITKVCDIDDQNQIKQVLEGEGFYKFDLIVSDVAPNTTGVKYADQKRSVELNKNIFEVAKHYLKPGGFLVMKVFSGEDLEFFIKQLKSYFRMVNVIKVSASRERSKEVYIICR